MEKSDIVETEECIASLFSSELQDRKKRNSNYSVRAFARDLGISAGVLSELIMGKRNLSEKVANKVFLKSENDTFNEKLMKTLSRENQSKIFFTKAKGQRPPALIFKNDSFERINSWTNFAVMHALQIDGVYDIPSLAKKIGISNRVVSKTIETLREVGIIKYQNNSYSCIHPTPPLVPGSNTTAVQKYLHELISKSLKNLESCDLKENDFSCETINISRRDLEKAKIILKNFRRSFYKEFNCAKKDASVYFLNSQLFSTQTNHKHLD